MRDVGRAVLGADVDGDLTRYPRARFARPGYPAGTGAWPHLPREGIVSPLLVGEANGDVTPGVGQVPRERGLDPVLGEIV